MATQPILERGLSSGEILFDGMKAEWRKEDGGFSVIDLSDVVIIGEYSTDKGPFVDDCFLVFVASNGRWEEISVYAEGFPLFTQHLSQLFGIDFSKTFNSGAGDWKSFIRYPAKLEGEELFAFQPPDGYTPATTFFRSVKMLLGIGVYSKEWTIKLSEAVKKEFAFSDDGLGVLPTGSVRILK